SKSWLSSITSSLAEPSSSVGALMARAVTTWYLEMLSPQQLRPAKLPVAEARVERADIPSPELSRFLYTAVGGQWYWWARLEWNYWRWLEYLDRPAVETLVLYVSGTPAGYVELEVQPDDNVEVAYFGLLPHFIGRRLGGYLLSVGVERAWAQGAQRVRGDRDEQRRAVSRALDAGITYFDTAAQYGDGASEENLGRVMRELGAWPRVVVGTKVRLGPDHVHSVGSAIRRSLEASL